MAFGDTVQSAQGTGTSGEASATLGAGATAGNLIVFTVGRSASHSLPGGAWGSISGYTALPNNVVDPGGANLAGAGWFKIAAGGETTVTTADTGESGNWCAAIAEYEGPFAASPLDVTAEDEANVSAVVTSQSSGTTATTAQANALAIAYFAADNGQNVTDSRSYTNSFTEVIFANSGARASVIQAKKVLSATGTVTTTFSTTDTGDEQYGAVAVFKKASSGAYTLDLAQGSYTLTGQALGLTAQRTLALAQGSYTLTGQALGLSHGFTLAMGQGSYTLTGQALALTAARTLAMGQGSYTLSGQAVALLAARIITAAQGSYTLTGQALALAVARYLALEYGIYTLTGQAVGLDYSSAAPAAIVHQGGIGLLDPDRKLAWDMLLERARRKRDEEEIVLL